MESDIVFQISSKKSKWRDLPPIRESVLIAEKLVAKPPEKFIRKPLAVPFHIPHRQLLEKIKYTKPEPPPLAGFKLKRKEPSLDEIQKLPSIKSASSVASESSQKREHWSRSRLTKNSEQRALIELSKKCDTVSKVSSIDERAKSHTELNVVNMTELIEQMKKTTNNSFLYMVYAVPISSKRFSPYCLKIVPYAEIDKSSFLTISTKGVTQYFASEVLFTTLEMWEKEYIKYTLLTKIKTFKYFRMWKAFYVWRKTIRWKKFTSAQKNLQKTSYLLNPILRDALLQINFLVQQFKDVRFVDLSVFEHLYFFYFIERQIETTENVATNLTEFNRTAVGILYRACNKSLIDAGFTVDNKPLHKKVAGARATVGDIFKPPKMTYIDQANKKRICIRLARFIMLIDVFINGMLFRLMHKTLSEVIEVFKLYELKDVEKEDEDESEEDKDSEGSDTKTVLTVATQMTLVTVVEENELMPAFLLNVNLEDTNIVCDPSEDVIITMYRKLILHWYKLLGDLKPYATDDRFIDFVNPFINNKREDRVIGYGQELDTILNESEYFNGIREKVVKMFAKNFLAAYKYLEDFNAILIHYIEDNQTNKEDIRDTRKLQDFRKLAQRYHDELELIREVGEIKNIGFFSLQLKNFKDTALETPKVLLTFVESTLPWIAKNTVDALMDLVDEINTFLDQDLRSTVDYVKYIEYLDGCLSKLDKMETDLEYAKEIYEIMDEYHMPVPPNDFTNFLGITVALGTLRHFVDKKMEDRAGILVKFSEQINKDMTELSGYIGIIKDELMNPRLISIRTPIDQAVDKLNRLHKRLVELQKKAVELKNYQKDFRLEVNRFDIIDEVMNDIKLRLLLWDSSENWEKTMKDWHTADFMTLDPEEIHMFIARYIKNCNQLEKGLPKNNEIVMKLKENVELMKDKLPVITNLRNPALRPRHWAKIELILNYKFQPDEKITLDLLNKINAFSYPTEFLEISGQASSEAGLEIMLKKVEDAWKVAEFVVNRYKDTKDVYLLGSIEDVQATLDESNIIVSTISSSKNVGPIKAKVDEWTQQLELFAKTLEEWMNCQQNWVYLEVIFSAPDIQRQLPNETKLFKIVNKSWKEIMRRTAKMPLAMPAVLYPGTLEAFQKNNALLDEIMKCLEAYLETKRIAFPRFYFLSNDELLDILQQTKNPHAVQPHLRKCFDAIAKLEFAVRSTSVDEDDVHAAAHAVTLTNDIVAMISPEGEYVRLAKGLKARGNVEDWLGRVEESMFTTLRKRMKLALADHIVREREEWLTLHPNQIILVVSQIMWARDVHLIFEHGINVQKELVTFEIKCTKNLNALAGLVRTDLSSVLRKILIALITIDVHAKDTITNLVQNNIQSSQSFDWLKMLRYYWELDVDNCIAKMSSARYVYGYEYLGAGGCLVITPLTDKCYLCLMGALQLDLGGAPAGPAGTGKTETTKDLSKSLAIQCVVFNCSEGLDYKMMGRFFSGLAQSGAWCCFDEFNRIDIEVLSVIAQQLITIRNAKAAKLARFMFEGREIKLVRQCATFITMNPGYAGRTELPDNLKAIFRPISMMVPDYALIAEVTLYSEGFESSKNLAQKMTQMYKLCSEQLSQQDHYDFGMRAVKSVLVMAGTLKRANPDHNENVVLIRALRDSNLPKFLSDDASLFQGILSDLFPGIILPEQDYGKLQKAIEWSMADLKLQVESSQITKVIQLYETMIVRWGVMLVGPTGGGKSAVLQILNKALGKLYLDGVEGQYYRPVHTYIMNPKSVSLGGLYGEVNPYTFEWKDGLLGCMVRIAVNFETDDHQWIICDGPVDAVWIENLNTVLDDNKMLCLANSERIKLTPYVHMVFEVADLAQASPATVSRCGMVYIDSEELRWYPYVKSWIERFGEDFMEEEVSEYLISLFDKYVDVGFSFIRKHCAHGIHQVEISKISMLCALMEGLMMEPKCMDRNVDVGRLKSFVCQSFIFSFMWSMGGNLTDNTRDLFESYFRDQFEGNPKSKLPPTSDLWNLFMNTQTKRFDTWTTLMPAFEYDPKIPFFEMLVPTLDTVRYGYIMERLIQVNKPVMFTGATGVGKSVIAKAVLNKMLMSGLYIPVTVNFSAQTSSFRTQEILELKLDKRKKNLLGAPVGKKVVVFVDDVNMPKLETYGAQPPIELLRQLLDYGGFYDRDKLFWKDIVDVVLTCACAPPGGGRNPMTARFVRHFGMMNIPAPNEFSLKGIFKAIMKGFLFNFSTQIQNIGDMMVNCAVEIYNRIAEDLLPTPAKSHYVFNIRDLSKCIQGILQADSGTMRESKQMERLFYHENLRVFHDRLINLEDKSYFYRLMKDVCSRTFGNPVLLIPEDEIITKPPLLLFGDFMVTGANKQDRIYEEIRDLEKMKDVLQNYLDDYNLMMSKDLKMIFFLDAIEHCTRVARILRAERGNGLLVGVAGMGKQSLTKLASHLNFAKCVQIELTSNYDHNSFFEDLRKMYFSAGCKNEVTVFLFTDTQIVQEEFLEDINNILNSGEVPNLFEGEEYEKVINGIREPAKSANINESSRDKLFEYFISCVRSNLHLVLCMSPAGDAFRRRCRMFPSLVNCCTIDWFVKWPEEALLSVAHHSFQRNLNEEACSSLSNICVSMHESMEKMTDRFYNEMRRHYYTTPSSYLELLNLYHTMYNTKKKKINASRDRISNGLKKLYETNSVIGSMKADLEEMEPILAAKSIAVTELMKTLVKEQAEADEVKKVVQEEEGRALVKAEEAKLLADDAQKDLDMALPAMEAATKALQALNKNDINELRVFKKPPQLVQFVMEAVCLLLGNKTDWASAKIVLGDTNFLKRLQDYDKDHVSDHMLKKLKIYINNKDFLPDIVATVSKVCRSMCMWVRAIDAYAEIYRVVEPKRKRQQAAERELKEVMTLLAEKQKKLKEVIDQLDKLQKLYEENLREMQELEDTMQLTAARLNRAGRLTMALGDEKDRWENLVLGYDQELTNLIGDAIIAAACVAYLGVYTSNYREELIDHWTKLCKKNKMKCSEKFSLITVLADPYEIRFWNTCGLPKDSVSTENAILVTQAGRWPLMIDPQEQANHWIRQMESMNQLKIIKLTDNNYMRTLETGIRIGIPVLLEDVSESLDPALGPVLKRQLFVQGGRLLIRLGDADVEYDKNFKFYLTTKLSNPHFLPEICIQVTIVNFTVTPSGLEDQLLADVVRLERPDLENIRSELIVRINNDKTQLKNIEDKILKLLFQSEGNILDDEELIETLNESKETSAVIASRLTESEATEEKISIAREKYRTVAIRGSVIYFVVALLADIDPMYQYSLAYFNQVFNAVIESSEKNDNLQTRLNILYREITLSIYTNVSRGLFERHKSIFSFMLCVAILKQASEITDSQWSFLIRGPVGAKATIPKPDIAAVTEPIWLSINYLHDSFRNFRGIINDCTCKINLQIGDFEQELELVQNNKKAPQEDWNMKLNDFEKLMLLKVLKEEKLIYGIIEFVNIKLGRKFIESPQISLSIVYPDTSNITPLVFILSTGSDPFSSFQRFAIETGNDDKIRAISLGQGQGPIAEGMINEGKTRGDWIFLQNCHLATSWMIPMERIIIKLIENADEVHKDFRVFMSSMPSKQFPVSVLQNSVKVTNEPPKGLRANVKRAFTDLLEEFFENHHMQLMWRKLIFGICVFHAVIQERKKFGSLGWNIVYEFNTSDRECALNTMHMFCADTNEIPWDALEYITGEITYGGRVTDYWDLRCLKTILKGFFSPKTLEPGYVYSKSGIYYCPELELLQEYRDFIETLPIIEGPEIFGMHENANIAFQNKETQSVIVTIMDCQPRTAAVTEGRSSEEIVYELAQMVIDVILTKVTCDDPYAELSKRDEKGRLPSLSTVLLQEIERFNKLLVIIHSSMENVQKAIKGFVVMSEQLEEVYKAFLNNQVPKMWSAKAYPSLKTLGSWIYDLRLRLDFVLTWMRKGPPVSFWISGFFFQQGFLTGVLQTFARKYNLPIDTLKFEFDVLPTTIDQEEIYKFHENTDEKALSHYLKNIPRPSDGVVIHGVFFDAGCWDKTNKLLVDPSPGELNSVLPAMWLLPVSQLPENDKRYTTPFYKTSIRAGVLSTTGHSTNFVMAVLLPTVEDQSYWILRGTALISQITD